MSVLEALKMYLQSLCFKLLMFSVRDNLLRCSSKDFCEWYIASKCLPLFENIYREIFCWKTLLPLQILPPSQYDPGGQRDRPRPPPLLALLNNTWSKCQPSTMTGNVSYSGISFFLRGKKKTQRHFHLPLRTLKMWKFSKRNSESDKDKQGLGDLSLAILSVLVWTLLKGFFIFWLWESISVWCANINSFKGKVLLALCLSYLTALLEGTPDFGYTSVTSICRERYSRDENEDSICHWSRSSTGSRSGEIHHWATGIWLILEYCPANSYKYVIRTFCECSI